MAENNDIGILKSLWTRQPGGRWGVWSAKGIRLKPKPGFDRSYFQFESDLEALAENFPGNDNNRLFFNALGTTDFMLKQSVLPVIAWHTGADEIRCIGTAFVISCTGYVITASHVIRDPEDEGYGRIKREGNTIISDPNVRMGVLIPLNHFFTLRGFQFFPFEEIWYWGNWKKGPLFHEEERFDYATDIAICKIPMKADGAAHQPLNLSLFPFTVGERAFAIGYAEMKNVPILWDNGNMLVEEVKPELYVSVGNVMNNFPYNHLKKEVRIPGPCFDFDAKIPGKMSGSPIFGAGGSVVRGVVSGSWSGEKHAYGSMLGPTMHLPLGGGMTLKQIMDSSREGIAKVQGAGL